MDTVSQLIDARPGFEAMEPACLSAAVPILDDIWMSSGTSNSYMIRTGAGRVIVNTGMGFEALTHKRLFDAICAGPTPYVVITQGHVDHVGGVAHFREPETRVLAQQRNAACQLDDERIQQVRTAQAYIWFRKTMDRAIAVAGEHPEVLIQDKPVPDILFEDTYAFDVAGVRFELLATPGGETVDSCIAWLPQRRIVFSGNMLGPLFPHFPNLHTIRGDKYRFIPAYLDSLRRLRELRPEVLVTGHFDPVVGASLIGDCLDRLEAAVEYVHRETLRGMNEGKDVFTLMREVSLPDHLRVGEGYGKVSWAVRTIWEGYMGWFKAQDTSELFPTQAREIHADLVEMAGIEAVIARGAGRLKAGDPEAALLLAEAALAAAANDVGALTLSLACHEVLLARSGGENFWEAGWLRTRIRSLQRALRKG